MQAALRLKDAELEERAALLLKTKAAIEQLQDELQVQRVDSERCRKARTPCLCAACAGMQLRV